MTLSSEGIEKVVQQFKYKEPHGYNHSDLVRAGAEAQLASLSIPDEKMVEIIKKVFGEGVACQYDYSLNNLSLDGITKRETKAVKIAISQLSVYSNAQKELAVEEARIEGTELVANSHKQALKAHFEAGRKEERERIEGELYIYLAQNTEGAKIVTSESWSQFWQALK